MSKLTLIEQETIIRFNRAEAEAFIYASSPTWIKRMDEYCSKCADFRLLRMDEHGKYYSFPKECVKVHLPRQLTDEQREKQRVRALENLHHGKV